MGIKLTPGFLVIVLLLVQPAGATDTCQHDAHNLRCVKYLKNYDGDTITVEVPGVHPLLGKNISVRVLGVDTPEIKGKLPCEKEQARVAQRLVQSLLKDAKRIDLINVQRDKYFRILADVHVDGKSIAQVLTQNHLAYAYDGGTKQHINWCQQRKPANQ